MIRYLLFSGALLVMMFSLLSCEDSMIPSGDRVCGSMNIDGSNFSPRNNSLWTTTWGRAFYISDEMVFHLSTKLYKRSMTSNGVKQLIPDSLMISDERYMEIDKVNQLLYFSANGDIYRVSFGGTGLTNLSPENTGTFIAPRLSSCGNYLTAIKEEKVFRLELGTGIWLELPDITRVLHAVYIGESDEYYLWIYTELSYEHWTSLYVLRPGVDSPEFILEVMGPDKYSPMLFGISHDYRYLAAKHHPSSYGGQYPKPLKIYDRESNTQIHIENCFSFAFSPAGHQLLYSRRKHDLADINLMNLATGDHTMLWDGILGTGSFSCVIDEFYWKHDATRFFYAGCICFRRR
ncbi:MAG: hypothetical protein U1C33_06860 [Candidatus Cloacimonadaceae bacterium]|nr:hypothetical protein [Candidatus Cloacimonadaceae bacterium]